MFISTDEIVETIHMIQQEHLDIRTVTMGISLLSCARGDAKATCDAVYDTVTRSAARLVDVCRDIEAVLKGQTGKITLTNSSDYPFNNSEKSVSLASVLDTTDYTIDTEVEVPINGESVGRIVIRDKLKNGFKIGFTGSAQSVTVKYTVRGGII